ncbi:MAG: hypothetical protein J2P38_10825 [Candidatus Dormibacteraeota bacterium]|nr:hypothetical protein [Candidatus Dormibacteraeota bacterium]
MRTYHVYAARSQSGWHLNVEREGKTHVQALEDAVQQVRYFLATLHEDDFDDARILITVDS